MPYPFGYQPPRPKMNGPFKKPWTPSPRPPPQNPTLSAGGRSSTSRPTPPVHPRPGVPRNSATVPRRPDGIGLTQRFRTPAVVRKPEEPVRSTTTSRVVGDSTRSLMDMDDTLLNAVDLDVIEKQVNTPAAVVRSSSVEDPQEGTSAGTANRTGSVVKAKRQNSFPGETPKRKKSRRNSGLIVLDMTKPPEPEEPIFVIPKAKSVGRTNQTRTIPVNPNSSNVTDRRPTIDSPRAAMIPKEPTVDLFDWDSQAFSSQVNQIVNDGGSKTPPPPRDPTEDLDEIPCYQEANVWQDGQDDPSEDDPPELDLDQDGQLVSQLFSEAVAREPNRQLTQSKFTQQLNAHSDRIPLNDECDTYSQYIRNEYSMVEENRANVADDAVDTQRAREYDSSQYRSMVEDDIRLCEQNLADMSNIDWDESVAIAGERPVAASVGTSAQKARLDSIFGKNGRTVEESPKRVAKKAPPLVSSHFQDLGPFYGLPNKIRDLLREFRGITEMYDWQKQCLALPAIVERTNLIYALPTSGGKTLVAEIIMFREVLLRRRSVMFIVPYVSLAQEKLAALSPFAVAMEFLVEEYSGGKGSIPPRKRHKKQSIFVCTIEKASVLLDSLIEADRANEIGLICIDELHMLGEGHRGVNLEVLITKVMAIQAGIQIVGMSATIGNVAEIAKFMSAEIFWQDFRPVELKEYVKCGSDLWEINHGARTLEEAFVNKQVKDFEYSDAQRRIDPDHIVALVTETIPAEPCLIFCPTKRRCEQLCSFLVDHLPKEIAEYRANERQGLIDLLANDGSTAILLPAAFYLGIAYHHSGLTFDERKLIEDAFRARVISLIICTSTLAAGVNLPAKRVIIRSPYIATEFLTLSRYKQMVGRAGRAGFGTEGGESILICGPKDINAVCDLLCSPMDVANSSLHVDNFVHLKNLILSAIGLGICSTRNDIQKFVGKTLLAIQADRLGVNLRKATDVAIATLYKENAIKAKSDGCLKNPANMTIRIDEADLTQDDIGTTQAGHNGFREMEVRRGAEGSSQQGKIVKALKKNARLEVNLLGKAAIRAGVHMERASRAYDELMRVGVQFNLIDELHLLYCIVMEDGGEIRPTEEDFIAFFNKLSAEETRIAKRFHISDYTISKILSRRLDKVDLTILRRFFRTLIVYNMWNLKPPQEVATRFGVDAGSVQTLMTNAAATASSLQRFCEQLPELGGFDALLKRMQQRLAHCCTAELIPLMELPAVKIGRARQLYKAGYTTLASIAQAKAADLVNQVLHMNYRTANQLILSAKAKRMEEFEELREKMDDYLILNNV